LVEVFFSRSLIPKIFLLHLRFLLPGTGSCLTIFLTCLPVPRCANGQVFPLFEVAGQAIFGCVRRKFTSSLRCAKILLTGVYSPTERSPSLDLKTIVLFPLRTYIFFFFVRMCKNTIVIISLSCCCCEIFLFEIFLCDIFLTSHHSHHKHVCQGPLSFDNPPLDTCTLNESRGCFPRSFLSFSLSYPWFSLRLVRLSATTISREGPSFFKSDSVLHSSLARRTRFPQPFVSFFLMFSYKGGMFLCGARASNCFRG